MSRNKTNTAEFFPHRVTHGKTMFKLEAKYGNDGYAFLFKLCEMLGAAEDHYLDLSDAGDWDFFVIKMRMEEEKCTAILVDLITWNKLDKELFEHKKIVWYEKFVQGLSQLYLNRRRELPVRPHFYCRNDSATQQTTTESTQSRVEESRVEESRECVLTGGENLLSSFGQFWVVYDKNVSEPKALSHWIKMTPHQRQLALDNVAVFVQAYPKYRYRPNPLRYLEEEMWNDELPTDGGEGKYKDKAPNPDTRDRQIPLGFEQRWEKFTQWFKEQDFKYVTKIREQLTPIELEKLLQKASASVVMDKMLAIENACDKYAKNKSVYLTINNWLNLTRD